MISDYLQSLARALDFDRSLSRRMWQEVEDHLCEAVAADPGDDRIAAERRAIANFGDPGVIAAQFAALSLERQGRRLGIATVLALAAVFIAMKVRVAWYAVAHCATGEDVRMVCGMVSTVDRYAFWLAVLAGVGGCAHFCTEHARASLARAYRRQIRLRFLCMAAAAALLVSVTSDGVLTAIRLFAAQFPAQFVMPVLSMALEIGCVAALVFQIRRVAQRTRSIAVLLGR